VGSFLLNKTKGGVFLTMLRLHHALREYGFRISPSDSRIEFPLGIFVIVTMDVNNNYSFKIDQHALFQKSIVSIINYAYFEVDKSVLFVKTFNNKKRKFKQELLL
jgi:hypothetical protein